MIPSISTLSTEALRVPVKAAGLVTAEVKTHTPHMAVVPFGTVPLSSQWHSAAWSAEAFPVMVLPVGPGAGRILTPHRSYDVWIRVTPPGGTNGAVLRSGTIRTTGPAPGLDDVPAEVYDFTAATYDFHVNVGDDIRKTFTIRDDEGNPYSWSGASISATIRPSAVSTTVLDSWGVEMLPDGVLRITLTDVQTTALGVGTYYYSIRVTKDDITRSWIKGSLVIES